MSNVCSFATGHLEGEDVSYRMVAAAVKGDQRESVLDILQAVGLDGYVRAETMASWSLASRKMLDTSSSSSHPPVAACLVGDWTLLINKKLAFAILDFSDSLTALVRSQSMTLFAVVADSNTGTFGFRLQEPKRIRFVLVEGDKAAQAGEPLECEEPIVPEAYSEEALLDIMDLLEIDMEDGLERAGPVIVYRHS